MEGLQLSSPITFVVKTPNRMVDDLQISCALDWTVAKIKKHLSNVYPSRPESKQQRLIYSGQLLLDHQVVKDFLREPWDGMLHTVHLVCPPGVGDITSEPSPSTSSMAEPTVAKPTVSSDNLSTSRTSEQTPLTPTLPQSIPSQTTANGLRHRGPNTPMQSPYNMYYQQMWNMNGQSPFQVQGYQQTAPGFVNHQQWMQQMQQMYHQQMAAGRILPPFMYMPPNMAMPQMHIWPQVPMGRVPRTPAAPLAPPLPYQPQPQMVPPQPPAPQPQQQAQAANQEVRMNAQGGMADDDDEENPNNDWLDKIYTLCRVGILLSIVWFYSSTGRFLALILLLMLIYMYQWGIFHWLLRYRNVQANNQQQQPVEQQIPEQEDHEDGNTEEVDNGLETEGNETIEGEQPAPPPPPPGPSVFTIVINFVSTFFTSLIPQQNDVIPAN